MRKNLPLLTLLVGVLSTSTLSYSQQTDRFAYAVTDVQPQGGNWSFLRKLNLQTGEYSQILLSGNDASLLAYDATTKKQFAAPLTDAAYGTTVNAAFATGVAAMAYDKKNNRLYYTPMFIDQLRYLDLKTMKVYFVTDRSFTGKAQKPPDQGNIVTRMVIAADGNGYAMTNDGRQLIHFTTGKKMQVTDLGTLVDDQSNTTASIHSSCSSYGGDMIADDKGNLYAISARNYVFKINVETKVATYLGNITGLPNNFTTNGAAVNDKNQVILSSAAAGVTSYFTVDHTNWTASPYPIAGNVWLSPDLANSNLLITEKKPAPVLYDTKTIAADPVGLLNNNKVSVYPNPVTANKFTLQFNQLEAGSYTIIVTDAMGRQVQQQPVNVTGDNQLQTVLLAASNSKGMYLVTLTDINSKTVFSTKLVVQ